MELELENVLKYDFYNDKLSNYHEIAVETINYLLQFKAFELISEDFFYKNMEFFNKFYVNLMEISQKIGYKYNNLMDEIFDSSFDGDARAVKGDYINEVKIIEFNKEMNEFETATTDYIDGLHQTLDELALSKMFATDMNLLKVLENDFNGTYQRIERIEEQYGKFEDSMDEY